MKRKKIVYEWWEAVVEIADDSTDKMKEQVQFWVHGEQWIKEADGDVELAYLRMLGQSLIAESMQWNLYGILKEWENREGWYPLDGSGGVKLVSVDRWEFSDDDFQVLDAPKPLTEKA